MTDTITLGRIAGIRIGIHWSWLVVFGLIAWTLAAEVFPAQNPDLSSTAYVAMALVATLLFFGSLLLHELGHAVQARRERVEIDGITLWLFGGIARFKGDLPNAGAEFRIAVAGPIVTLGIGATCALLASTAGLPEAADGVAAWLGYTNLALLAFNLLPALPLDGGRVLRSLLWMRNGDRARATFAAGHIARVLAYLMIGFGIASLLFFGAFAGAWLAFIGWFLLQASAAEVRWVAATQALAGIHVDDLMTREPVSVEPSMSLGRFVDDVVWNNRHTTYPVVASGRPVGLLPFRRVAESPRTEWDETTVGDRMLTLEQIPVFDRGDDVLRALAALQESGAGRGLVVDDGRLVGILSTSDIADALEVRRQR
jgi:Zn-dependent protease/predicted transcriptional regulator